MNSAFILNGLNVNVKGMEAALVNYVKNPQEKSFDIKSIPVDTQVGNIFHMGGAVRPASALRLLLIEDEQFKRNSC